MKGMHSHDRVSPKICLILVMYVGGEVALRISAAGSWEGQAAMIHPTWLLGTNLVF